MELLADDDDDDDDVEEFVDVDDVDVDDEPFNDVVPLLFVVVVDDGEDKDPFAPLFDPALYN